MTYIIAVEGKARENLLTEAIDNPARYAIFDAPDFSSLDYVPSFAFEVKKDWEGLETILYYVPIDPPYVLANDYQTTRTLQMVKEIQPWP